MAKTKATEIPGFGFDALIPRDALGRVVEAIYLNGGQVRNVGALFDYTLFPHLTPPRVQNGAPHVGLLPAPKGTLKKMRFALIEYIAKNQPAERKGVVAYLTNLGFRTTSAHTEIARTLKDKMIVPEQKGVYILTKAGQKFLTEHQQTTEG